MRDGARRLVLASASPRRAELLTAAGLTFDVAPADLDETPRPGEAPDAYVARLAVAKAAAIAAAEPGAVVLAADTTVDVDGEILEKPVDEADLRRMLGLLSGRTHRVHTGVAVRSAADGDGEDPVPTKVTTTALTTVVTTTVTFVTLTADDIDWYVATGDGMGKAGGYGIQGRAARLVRRVDGSVTNVIGLPLAETIDLLHRAGLRAPVGR